MIESDPHIKLEVYQEFSQHINDIITLLRQALSQNNNIDENKKINTDQSFNQYSNLIEKIDVIKKDHPTIAILMNHDFLSRLHEIQGQLNLILRHNNEAIKPDAEITIKIIQTGIQAMAGFVSSPEFQISPTIISINEFCRELQDFFDFRNKKQSPFLEYEFIVHSEIKNLFTHKETLQQMIFNMFKNSQSFQSTKFKIYITKAGDHARIYIEDNGQEIPESDIPDIFKFGFSKRNTNKIHHSGVGLGLADVRLKKINNSITFIPSNKTVPFNRMKSLHNNIHNNKYGSLFCISLPLIYSHTQNNFN